MGQDALVVKVLEEALQKVEAVSLDLALDVFKD